MTQSNLPAESAVEPYEQSCGPKPQRRLLRTWFRRPRRVRQFAPRINFDGQEAGADPAIAAHWGEHLFIDDFLTVLHRDGTTTSVRHIVTQLHSGESLMQWDQLTRLWDTRIELNRNLKARLFLPDGTTRNAQKHLQVIAAPDKRPNRRGRNLQIAFAPLRPGVIVEFEEQYDRFVPDEIAPVLWNHFYLTTNIPALHRRFTVAVSAPFRLEFRVHNADRPPQEQEVKGYKVCTWDLSNVEGTEIDEWTPPISDFLPWVDIATSPTWAPFAQKLYKELEPALAPPDVRTLAITLAAKKGTGHEKSLAAYQYTAQNVRYGRPPAEALARNIRHGTQMIEDLRGDCKDKSALLVQLLRAMELQAHVAVVLTGDSGRTPFLPSMRFNHALVRLKIDGQTIWLDAANGPFGFGELPSIDENISALVLHRHGFQFDHIPARNNTIPIESRCVTGRLTPEGSYAFRAEVTIRGESAARLRMLLADRNENHRREVLQSWLGNDYPGAVGHDFEYADLEDLSKDMSYSCQAHLELVARPLKNLLLLRIPWANALALTGPLSAIARRQPLVVPAAYHNHEQHTIELPDSVHVVAAPEPMRHQCEWSTYQCTMTALPGKIVCQREFTLHGGIVPGEHFPNLKEHWRQCGWSDNAEIVLAVNGAELPSSTAPPPPID